MLSLVLWSLTSMAAPLKPTTPYKCHAVIVANDASIEFTFKAPPVGEGGHGGAPFEFKSGEYFLAVIADGKWRGVSWWKSKVLIAEGVTASKSFFSAGHTFIVYNPKDVNEQAYVTCDHDQLDEFPKE